MDNGFIPGQTLSNIKRIAEHLDVRLHIEKNNQLSRCIKYHLKAWTRRPCPEMIGFLCVGCRMGIDLGILRTAREHGISVVMTGATPFEGVGYKENMLKLNPNSKHKLSMIAGFVYQCTRNPLWLLNGYCLLTQIREFYHHYLFPPRRTPGYLYLAPFWSYIRWEEKKVDEIIQKELGWECHPGIESTWRSDCDIAILKTYLYKETLGFNDKDDGLSCLIRDNQITRVKALERLNREANIPEPIIAEIVEKIGVSFSDIQDAISRGRK